MKTLVTVFFFLIIATATSFAGGHVDYFRGSIQRVDRTFNFAGATVPADQVCLAADGKTLKAVIPAHLALVCDNLVPDYSDSTKIGRAWSCIGKTRKVMVPEQVAETLLPGKKTCVDEDHTDSVYPTCRSFGPEQFDLTYTIEYFRTNNYTESPIGSETRTIRDCE